MLQRLMEFEAQQRYRAGLHERNAERFNQRNGYRERGLGTHIGAMRLRIPKLRSRSYLPSFLEPRNTSEQALVAVVQEAYLKGGEHAQGRSQPWMRHRHDRANPRVYGAVPRRRGARCNASEAERPMASAMSLRSILRDARAGSTAITAAAVTVMAVGPLDSSPITSGLSDTGHAGDRRRLDFDRGDARAAPDAGDRSRTKQRRFPRPGSSPSRGAKSNSASRILRPIASHPRKSRLSSTSRPTVRRAVWW